VRRIRVSWFDGTGGRDVSFLTYRVELQQFLPLWYTQRALALRGYVTWIDLTQGDQIPFQRLVTNYEPDQFRGYLDFRWRDKGMLALTAEYRFPWFAVAAPQNQGVDMYLLADFGQVFGRTEQIALDAMTASFGGGFRLVGRRGIIARAEVAFSNEGPVFRFRTDQIFQYMRGGLFYGRDPVPSR
jgi:hypothetical protein